MSAAATDEADKADDRPGAKYCERLRSSDEPRADAALLRNEREEDGRCVWHWRQIILQPRRSGRRTRPNCAEAKARAAALAQRGPGLGMEWKLR